MWRATIIVAWTVVGVLMGAVIAVLGHLEPSRAVILIVLCVVVAWLFLAQLLDGKLLHRHMPAASHAAHPVSPPYSGEEARQWLDDFLRAQQE